MTTQASLFKVPAPEPIGLTDRQQRAWDCIRSMPGGVSADEIGAAIHAHGPDHRCEWCTRDALQVIRSVALAPLVVKRRTGLIEPREARYRAQEPSSQLAELPADLFGSAA